MSYHRLWDITRRGDVGLPTGSQPGVDAADDSQWEPHERTAGIACAPQQDLCVQRGGEFEDYTR